MDCDQVLREGECDYQPGSHTLSSALRSVFAPPPQNAGTWCAASHLQRPKCNSVTLSFTPLPDLYPSTAQSLGEGAGMGDKHPEAPG